jgi:uncharacterized protein
VTSRGRWLAAVVLATGVAWLQLAGVPAAARLWAALLLVPLPALMVVQAHLLRGAEPLPRREAYISSIITLWLLAGATAIVALLSGYTWARLGLTAPLTPSSLGLVGIITLAGIALLFAFRFAGFRETAVLRELLPVTRRERVWFVGVSVTAGVTEEVVFRGFLLAVLTDATGSAVLAVLLSSGAFGVVHAYQQPVGALRAALLGALLAIPVLLHGALLPAILAHALIDLLSGLWLARYLLR